MAEPLRIQGLLAKEESVYGTDPTPVGSADGVRGVGNLWGALTPEYVFPNRREDTVSGSLIKVAPGLPAGRIVTLDYTVQLMGAGAAYSSVTPVRPECDPLLMACGMSRTHVDTGGSETVTYALTDTGHSSCTIYAYAGKKEFKIVGVRGTWTWNPTAGGLGEIRFQLQGMLSAVANAAVPTISSYDSVLPPPLKGAALAIVPSGQSSWTPKVANLEVVAGVEVERLDDVSGSDALEGFFIPSMSPMVRVPARVVDLTDYAAYTYAGTGLTHTIDATLGSAQYNRVDLAVASAYLTNDPGHGEDNRFAAYDLEYECQDLSLVFD